jgi:hypothetical protein
MIFSIIFLLFIAFGFAWVVKDYQKFKKQKEKETLNKIKNNGKSNTRI